MQAREMEDQINSIAEKAYDDIQSGFGTKLTIKVAVCAAFKAGMEAARAVYTS